MQTRVSTGTTVANMRQVTPVPVGSAIKERQPRGLTSQFKLQVGAVWREPGADGAGQGRSADVRR